MKTQRSLIVMMAVLLSPYLLWVTPSAAKGNGAAAPGLWPNSTPRPSAAQAQKKKVKLAVTVKDPDGKAVGNARVNVWHDRLGPLSGTPDYQGDTTPEGVAVIEVMTTGGFFSGKAELNLVIRVVKTDFEVKEDKLRVSGNVPDEVTRTIIIRRFAVQSGEMTMKIRVETWDGRPVAGADVVVWANTWPTRKYFNGTTDGRGNAEVRVTQFDDFEIKASKEGLGEASLPAKVPGTGEIPTHYFTVKLPKPNGAVVTVVVRDEKNQQGVGDALVSINGSRFYYGVTDATGKAILVIPEKGKLAVNVTQRTYESLSNAEVSLSDGETEKTFEFALKPKHPKEGEGQNSVEVIVVAADKTDNTAVARANLPLPWARVKVGPTTAPTDASGRVKIYGDFEGDVEVIVEAEGYKRQARTIHFTPTVRFSGRHASATFLMQAEDSRDYVEVTVVADEKDCSGNCPPIEGSTVTSGGTTATTDANGKAILYGFFDDENIKAQKAGYETQVQQVGTSRSSDGVARGSVMFKLKPESTEGTVEVIVMGVSPSGGNPSPISGAAVKVGQAIASTDENGRARLKGEFGEEALVTVQARGYVRQSTKVSIGRPSRTAAASLYLQPEMPIRLIVEVRDSAQPNNPLAEASVYLRDPGKPVAGTSPLAAQQTNVQGEASIEFRGSADELAKIRAGLRIHVEKDKYLAKLSDVTADLLQPSMEARRVTVYLERDWAELQQAVAALEQKVLAWNNDLASAGQAGALVRKLAEQAPQARDKVAALLREIESAGQAAGGVNGISAAGLQCRQAARLKSNIQGYKLEADAKEQSLKALLDNALALAARCSSANDGDAVRTMYRNATELARAINALEKKALGESNDLNNLAREKNDLKKIIEEVEKKVAEIGQEAAKAEQAVATAGTHFVRSDNLRKSLKGRHTVLSGELASLKAQYGLDNFVEGLPPDLDRRVEGMTQLLGKENNNFFGGPNLDWTKTVQDVATQVQRDKARAEQSLAFYRGGTSGSCVVEAMDDVVREIGAVNTSVTIELSAAALNEKAEGCIKKGRCQLIINDVPVLLEHGVIDTAAEKINQARAQGCDVSGLDELLDYWKTLRDGVVYLKALGQNCRFREAYEWSLNVPASIRNRPLMKEATTEIYNGLKAQERIEALQRSAKAEVTRTNKMASAEPFIRQAEQAAAPFACLVNEASRFRSEYQVTGLIHKPLAVGVLGAPVDKLEVEEIPDDADEAGKIISDIKKKDKEKLEVEEIPEDENAGASTAGKRPATNTGGSSSQTGGGGVVTGNQNWAGTWVNTNGVETVYISGGGDSISASMQYKGSGFSGSGQWTNCRTEENTAKCSYTANHDDNTKTGTRSGTLEVTLNGDTISGRYFEDTPQWNWKPGYGPHNVTSAMVKGAVFSVTFKRQ